MIPAQFHDIQPWTSRDVTGVNEVPKRLVIVGGGVVACEAATWMAALGSRVTVVARLGLLAAFEPFVAEHVGEALRKAGVALVQAEVTAVRREGVNGAGLGEIHGGPVTVSTSAGQFEADEVLVATGRRPRLSDVGLESIGLTEQDIHEGRQPEWLYAIGDAGSRALTHMGKYDARVLGAQLAGADEYVPDEVPTPQAIFTDPQVATVGMTEAEAAEAGIPVVTSQVGYTDAAGSSLLRDDAAGAAKIVVNAETGCLLGATFVGPGAAEQIHAATIAIVGSVPVRVLRHAVPSYPTVSELWLRLLEPLPAKLRA